MTLTWPWIRSSLRLVFSALALHLGIFDAAAAIAQEGPVGAMSNSRAIPAPWIESIGAQLYDDWPRALRLAGPFQRHPLWSGSTNVRPQETWRCVNCHGWDFLGSAGVGGDLGVVDGVPGLRHLVGVGRNDIRAMIRADSHGYSSAPLNPEALSYLAGFLAKGQTATVELVGRARTLGVDRAAGGERYASVCQICHGANGDALNLGTERAPETLSTLARRLPWRFLHTVRFGHGGIMPSFTTLEEQEFLNLLIYAARDLR
jgi:mono/diheme cytochrome c family protein